MPPFLLNYLSSFRAIVITWPLIAGVLVLPVLAWQYRCSGELRWSRALTLYFFILCLLSLVLFTTLPLPNDFDAYCAARNRPVLLIPFRFIIPSLHYGNLWDVLQILLNVLVFVPFGIYARTLLRLTPQRTLLLGLGVSLLIEATQFSALWGLAPCRYRVADIDDVILNVFGTWLGVLAARVLISSQKAAS